ncbi:MAG: metallophosphoesterase family protein [Candidatus Hydrogenedentes bacterium]|nr:metallophosphoesterase family protein [Candidatus Hydrogenedentota bacterium]
MKISKHLVVCAIFLCAGFTAVLASAAPPYVYLTYSDAPDTSIDINLLIPAKVPAVDVYYDTESRAGKTDAYINHVNAAYHQTLMELSDRRALYVAALKGLKPGTVYYFVAGEAKYGMTTERKFRTLPGGSKPLRFVNGGDMGADGRAIPLLTLAGKQDPDFGVVGGDIAYVNGLLGGYATWDRWLENWDRLMITTDGRMVPIVAAIGNHETNSFESNDLQLRAPWYTGLFGRQGTDIYYTRRFGNDLAFFFLDSGHLNSHAGAQTEWLRRELEKYKDVKYKFAAYHVPLYPAHRPFDGAGSQLGRTHWGPLFDQYGLTVAFEHHDRVFKRSKPLKGNQVVRRGTIYVGDGCFGRDPRTIDPQPRWYNAIEKDVAHFWVVDVARNGLRFKAIDDHGRTIDTFSVR